MSAQISHTDLLTVPVNLGDRSYQIVLPGAGHSWPGDSPTDVPTGSPGGLARSRNKSGLAFVVVDRGASPHLSSLKASLEKAGYRVESTILDPGEGQKSLTVAASLYEKLLDLKADRKTLLVALGGGVTGDLTGYVAATYLRGLPFLMVPTTLLSMVDSSVGGKTGVNLSRGKNLVGCFHQPIGVWIDIGTLKTLPDREYRSGLAEVVKYGMIMDAPFFDMLEQNVAPLLARDPKVLGPVVARCCELKADVVSKDEREETGLRAILNYGHTFAHAYETVAGYGSWLHGEAVSAGMQAAAKLAVKRGLISKALADRQKRLLEAFDLPVERDSGWPIDTMIDIMRSDKKAEAGQLRFILPVRAGEVRLFADVAVDEVVEALGTGK